MSAFTTTRRALAIAAALACTTGALTVLLQDIIGPPASMLGHWEIHHTLAVLTVLVVILFAELLWDAIAERLWVSVGGFALVGLMGVGMVLYNSVGNQAAVADTAAGRNTARATARADAATAKKALTDAQAKIVAEAGNGGCKRNCTGIKEQLPMLQATADRAEGAAKTLGEDEPVGKSAERLSALLAMAGVDRAKSLPIISELDPILRALLWELGSIFSWGFIRDRRKQLTPAAPAATVPATDDAELAELRERFFAPDNDPGPQPTPPGNRRRRRQPSATVPATVAQRPSATVHQLFPAGNRAQRQSATIAQAGAWAWLLAYLQRNGCLQSQDEMAEALKVNVGTVSKWLEEFERGGRIIRTTVGRRKEVRLADPATASA